MQRLFSTNASRFNVILVERFFILFGILKITSINCVFLLLIKRDTFFLIFKIANTSELNVVFVICLPCFCNFV